MIGRTAESRSDWVRPCSATVCRIRLCRRRCRGKRGGSSSSALNGMMRGMCGEIHAPEEAPYYTERCCCSRVTCAWSSSETALHRDSQNRGVELQGSMLPDVEVCGCESVPKYGCALYAKMQRVFSKYSTKYHVFVVFIGAKGNMYIGNSTCSHVGQKATRATSEKRAARMA